MDLYTIGCTIVYVDMENLFLFQFCLRDLFVENEDAQCYARPIHGKGALALGQFSTRATLSHPVTGNRQTIGVSDKNTDNLRNTQRTRVSNYKDAEEQEFSHSK